MTVREKHGLSALAMTAITIAVGLLSGIAGWAVYTTHRGEVAQAALVAEVSGMRLSIDRLTAATAGVVLRSDFIIEVERQRRIDDRQTARIDALQTVVSAFQREIMELKK